MLSFDCSLAAVGLMGGEPSSWMLVCFGMLISGLGSLASLRGSRFFSRGSLTTGGSAGVVGPVFIVEETGSGRRVRRLGGSEVVVVVLGAVVGGDALEAATPPRIFCQKELCFCWISERPLFFSLVFCWIVLKMASKSTLAAGLTSAGCGLGG